MEKLVACWTKAQDGSNPLSLQVSTLETNSLVFSVPTLLGVKLEMRWFWEHIAFIVLRGSLAGSQYVFIVIFEEVRCEVTSSSGVAEVVRSGVFGSLLGRACGRSIESSPGSSYFSSGSFYLWQRAVYGLECGSHCSTEENIYDQGT